MIKKTQFTWVINDPGPTGHGLLTEDDVAMFWCDNLVARFPTREDAREVLRHFKKQVNCKWPNASVIQAEIRYQIFI